MKIFCKDVVELIEKIAPPQIAEEWDNSGFIVGDSEKEVKTIVVCLDVTKEILNFAIEKNADLIISHHPVIFKGLKKINQDDPKGRILYKALQNDVCIYAAHTNFDFAENGLNTLLAEKIGLHYSNSLVDYRQKTTENSHGIGRIGELLEPVKLVDFVNKIKKYLNISNIRVIGDLEKEIKKVAVFCGGFDETLLEVARKRADVIVTGDLKYHIALEIKESNFNAIDAGHFGTEYIFVEAMKNILSQKFTDINVITHDSEKDPFIFI